MKINLTCCSKPTLFKGEKAPVTKAAPAAQQPKNAEPKKDTVEISTKKPETCECKCECKCEGCK